MSPFTPKKKLQNGKPSKPVPCGKCPACLARRASGWSFRLLQEDKRSVSSFFITLTYGEHAPTSRNNFMTLSTDDIQKFYKKLRKTHASHYDHTELSASNYRPPIKYYTVGEYGGKYKRPHYHAIIFNADLKLMYSKTDIKIIKMSNFDGKAQVNCFQWDKGFSSVGTVSGASIGYTLKYMCKARWKPMHSNDDRTREFSLMSKGLGDNYLSEASIKWHTAKLSERMYLSIEGGKKIAMPRYYKQKIYTDEQRNAISFWTEKKICEAEKILLQNDDLETYKDAQARVTQEYNKMYKRATQSRPLE